MILENRFVLEKGEQKAAKAHFSKYGYKAKRGENFLPAEQSPQDDAPFPSLREEFENFPARHA